MDQFAGHKNARHEHNGPKMMAVCKFLDQQHCNTLCIRDYRYFFLKNLAWAAMKHSDRRGNAEFAGVDNAGVDKSAPCCRDGICRSGQISTMWQGWTLQEWTMGHHVTGVDNEGVDNAGVVKCLWKMCWKQVESHRLYVRSTYMSYQLTVVCFVLLDSTVCVHSQ